MSIDEFKWNPNCNTLSEAVAAAFGTATVAVEDHGQRVLPMQHVRAMGKVVTENVFTVALKDRDGLVLGHVVSVVEAKPQEWIAVAMTCEVEGPMWHLASEGLLAALSPIEEVVRVRGNGGFGGAGWAREWRHDCAKYARSEAKWVAREEARKAKWAAREEARKAERAHIEVKTYLVVKAPRDDWRAEGVAAGTVEAQSLGEARKIAQTQFPTEANECLRVLSPSQGARRAKHEARPVKTYVVRRWDRRDGSTPPAHEDLGLVEARTSREAEDLARKAFGTPKEGRLDVIPPSYQTKGQVEALRARNASK